MQYLKTIGKVILPLEHFIAAHAVLATCTNNGKWMPIRNIIVYKTYNYKSRIL